MLTAVASFLDSLLARMRALSRGTALVSAAVFVALGLMMNGIGHALSIAWFKSWWQVLPCYLGYVLPLAILLRPLPANEQWRWSVLAFIPLELIGYAIGTSVIADDNVIAAVVGPHNFTLAMVLIVTPTPIIGNAIVDVVIGVAGRVGDRFGDRFGGPPSSAP